jgi:hypothetical protein
MRDSELPGIAMVLNRTPELEIVDEAIWHPSDDTAIHLYPEGPSVDIAHRFVEQTRFDPADAYGQGASIKAPVRYWKPEAEFAVEINDVGFVGAAVLRVLDERHFRRRFKNIVAGRTFAAYRIFERLGLYLDY